MVNPPATQTSSTDLLLSANDSAGASTARYLEALVSAWVDALNTRELHPQANAFQCIDTNFVATPGIGAPTAPKALTFPAYLSHMQDAADETPEFQICVLDFDTNVQLRNGTAQVFVNYEVNGAPVGLSRRAMAIFMFRRTRAGNGDGDGVWRVYTLQLMGGMDPGGS